MKINRSNTLTNRNIDPILIAVKLVFLRCRSVRPAWFQPLRHYRGSGTSTLITPRRKTPCLTFRKSRRLLSALRLNTRKDSGHCRKIGTVHRLSSSGRAESEDAACRHHPLMLSMTEAKLPVRNARQDIHRQAAERLALVGGSVSVRQSLPDMRSWQSQPLGCCQSSGFAAGEPTRPAKSVLGGFATSSAPAFPSSCAAATAAAAAVRGSEVVYHCATTIDKAHHLRISVLYYSCTIVGIAIYELDTYLCQSLLSTAIPSIVDNETFFDSPLRGNFGPTSATGSASPSLSGTHYGREHLCDAEGKK